MISTDSEANHMQLIDNYNLVDMLIMGTLLICAHSGHMERFRPFADSSGEPGFGSAACIEILSISGSLSGQNFQARSSDLDDPGNGNYIHSGADRFSNYS